MFVVSAILCLFIYSKLMMWSGRSINEYNTKSDWFSMQVFGAGNIWLMVDLILFIFVSEVGPVIVALYASDEVTVVTIRQRLNIVNFWTFVY